MPPRPSGQRPEPDRRGTGAFGNPFGNGNFQFSFGIGGFPFGFIGAVGGQGTNPFGFGPAHPPVSAKTLFLMVNLYVQNAAQLHEERALSNIFMYIGLALIVWIFIS